MTVSTYERPDQTVGGSQYKGAIDAAAHVNERIGAGFACNESDPADLRVQVRAGVLGDGTEIAAQQTAALTAPTTHGRKDIVYITAAGVVGVQEGTEAASPVDPTLTDDGRIRLARINWTAGLTEISNTELDDLRIPGETLLATARTIVANWLWKIGARIDVDHQRTDAHGAAAIARHKYTGINDASPAENIDYVELQADAVSVADGAEEGKYSITVKDGAGGSKTFTVEKDGVKFNGAALGAGGSGVTVAKVVHQNTDGDNGPGSGFIGSDGRLYAPVTYNPWGGFFFYGKSAAIVSASPTGGRYGFADCMVNVGHYGKVTKAVFLHSRLYALTELGYLLGAGYDVYGDVGGGGNTEQWKLLAGPGDDEYGNATPLNKTISDFDCSGTRWNGGTPNNPTISAILARTNDGLAYFWGYGGYGNGAGATTSANSAVQVLEAEGSNNPVTNVTQVYCFGGQYVRGYIVESTGDIRAFGYNASYGALGVGDTTNRSYAAVTNFPDHTAGSRGGVTVIRNGGFESEGVTWCLYGNGELHVCGAQGAAGHHGGGTTTDQTSPNLVKSDCADFWPSIHSSVDANCYTFLRTTGNDTYFAGFSHPENLPALTASQNYTTFTQCTSDLFASGHPVNVANRNYSGATENCFIRWSDGYLYALGVNTKDYFGWADGGAFTAGQWEKVPLPLSEGDSVGDDRDDLIVVDYSYGEGCLKTTNGEMFQAPGASQTSGAFGQVSQARLGGWMLVFGGACK